MQLLKRNGPPPFRGAVDVQDLALSLWSLQVTHAAALHQSVMQMCVKQAEKHRQMFRIRRVGSDLHVLRSGSVFWCGGALCKKVELVPELNDVFLVTNSTCNFAARHFRATRGGVAAEALAR